MAAEERWYFTKEQLGNTPSRKCGLDADKELSSRQQAANFMQDLGQRIRVNQLCINTAIVYMHRFYMFHSFTKFHRNAVSVCALFLAAKVEEQPRKLEFILKWAHTCLHHDAPALDQATEVFMEQSQELVINENIMLQTLGFDVAIDHPHTHVVKCCQLVRASKDLAQTSYFMATNSLHLTTMSVQYKPTVVACVCIHLACKWACWEIPKSSEGKAWFWYVDRTVTDHLLEELTTDFVAILERCPSRLKRKMLSCGGVNDKLPDEIMNLDKRFSGNSNSPSFPSNPQIENPFDRERSSSMSSTSSGRAPTKGGPLFDNGPTQAPPNPDKNGAVSAAAVAAASDAKARAAKKEHAAAAANAGSAGRSSSSTGGSQRHSALQVASPMVTSPRRSQQAVLTGNTSVSATSTSSTTGSLPDMSHNSSVNQGESPALTRKSKPDGGSGGGSNRMMTPKEYRERKKREMQDRETERVTPVTAPTVPTNQKPQQQQPPPLTSSHGTSSNRMERADRERDAAVAKGLALANNSSAKQGQQPPQPSSSASGVRPSSHHQHQQHHNRRTPEKQRHHQQLEAERYRSGGGGGGSGGSTSGHLQRGQSFPSHSAGAAAVEESGVSAAAMRNADGNHVGRPTSRSVTRPNATTAPTRQAPPPPLLTPSPPLQDDDHDGQVGTPSDGPCDRSDTLVNPLDGRAMVIPTMDSRMPPSSRSNHSADPLKGSSIDHRRREEQQRQQRVDEYLKVAPAVSQPPPTASLKRHAPSGKESKERLIKHHKSKAWPAEPSPISQAPPHHQTNVSLTAPPADQKPVVPNQVLPLMPHVADAKPLATNPASHHHHQHSVKVDSTLGVVKRPIVGAAAASQPPHHQTVKCGSSLSEVQRGTLTHAPVKVDPTVMAEDKLHPRVKPGRGDATFGDAHKRMVSAPVLQQPQFIKVDPHVTKVERGSGAQDLTKDVVGLPSLIDAKVKMETTTVHHRHPVSLEPITQTLEEVKPAVTPAVVSHPIKTELVGPAVTQLKHDLNEASVAPPAAKEVAQTSAVASLVPTTRESRTKVSSAQGKDVRPASIQPPRDSESAPVVVAPPTKEVKCRSAGQVSAGTDNMVKPRTSARREGKETKVRYTPAASAMEPANGKSVLPSTAKTQSPAMSSQPAASIVPAEIPVSVFQPVRVEPPIPVAPTLAPLPVATSSSKHERREKHRHKDKDRDKDRSSKERKKEEAAANKALLQQQQIATSTPPPAIKLTIAKDRLQMSNSGDSGASSSRITPETGSMGLKIKIPKDKLASSNARASSSKSHNSMSSTLVVTNPCGDGSGDVGSSGNSNPPVPSLGLKIKITKDRMGSKVMSVESSKDRVPESRKRERAPSPKASGSSQVVADNNDDRATAAKTPKLTRAATRRNSETGSRGATPDNPARLAELRQSGPVDVPPSSNTRSARGQEQAGPRHPGGGRGRPPHHGRGGGPGKQQHGGYMGHPMAPYGGPPAFYPQMYPYPPPHPHPSVASYYNHPPPQFYNQPPPYGLPHHMGGPMPPHPHQGHRFQGHPPPGHQGSSMPPLPREPPPAIPPPPPE